MLDLIEHNAKGDDPPMNEAALSQYYNLLGEATNDRESFLKEDLTRYSSALPHSLLLGLMHEQHRDDNQALIAQQKQANLVHAQEVLKPDILAAGIDPAKIKPRSMQAATFNQFTGRLSQAIEQFRTNNKRPPNDDEVKQIGQSLLMQGFERGTAGILPTWLGGGDKSVRAFQTDPGEFYPNVPSKDRAQIVDAYKARNGGAMPTEGQIQFYYMQGVQQRQPAQRQASPRPRLPMAQTVPLTPEGPGPQGAQTAPQAAPAPAPASPAADQSAAAAAGIP